MFATLLTLTLGLVDPLSNEPSPFQRQGSRRLGRRGSQRVRQGWRKVPVWAVVDGNIVCTGKGFGFLRYGRREFDDFAFHVEFRMEKGCNSGIGIRTRPFDAARSRATRPSLYSYEIQFIDDAGKPPTVHSSGSLYRYVAPSKNRDQTGGAVEPHRRRVRRHRIKVTLNGELIVDVDQRQNPVAPREAAEGLRLPSESWRQHHLSLGEHPGNSSRTLARFSIGLLRARAYSKEHSLRQRDSQGGRSCPVHPPCPSTARAGVHALSTPLPPLARG